MGVLEEISGAATAVAGRVRPSVVAIGRSGRGAGVVFGANRVVTNAHNLRDRTTTITFADGRSTQGAVVGVDAGRDLAVLEVDTADAPAIAWGESGPTDGAVVFALANPGGRGVRATFGTVTALEQAFRGPAGRRVTGAFEHTAPLARGSSGGPVVDAEGRLLGINTSRVGEGFYLAQTADAVLKGRLEALSRGESVAGPRLGVGLAPSAVAARLRAAVGLSERDGLLVRHVEPDSPAAAAGLEQGDLLVAAGDRELRSADDLLKTLDSHDASQELTLTVLRAETERTVSVSFAPPAAE